MTKINMKFNASIKSLAFLLTFCFSPLVCASTAELVLDMPNESVLPHRFRTTEQPLPPGFVVKGFKELGIAGTSQFSEKALLEIIKHFPAPFIVVDLRQESHGFIDGNAVTWLNKDDNLNRGKSAAQIQQIERQLLDDLKQQPAITVIAEAKSAQRHVLSLPNKTIQTEQQLVESIVLQYQRFYITNHFAPVAKDVDEFIKFIKKYPATTKFLFHCRGGAGRTTTYMVMLDMMRNAKQLSFDEIMQRQIALGGENFFRLPVSNDYKYLPAKQRLAFLKKFYEYCHGNQNNYKTSWTQWVNKTRKVKKG